MKTHKIIKTCLAEIAESLPGGYIGIGYEFDAPEIGNDSRQLNVKQLVEELDACGCGNVQFFDSNDNCLGFILFVDNGDDMEDCLTDHNKHDVIDSVVDKLLS